MGFPSRSHPLQRAANKQLLSDFNWSSFQDAAKLFIFQFIHGVISVPVSSTLNERPDSTLTDHMKAQADKITPQRLHSTNAPLTDSAGPFWLKPLTTHLTTPRSPKKDHNHRLWGPAGDPLTLFSPSSTSEHPSSREPSGTTATGSSQRGARCRPGTHPPVLPGLPRSSPIPYGPLTAISVLLRPCCSPLAPSASSPLAPLLSALPPAAEGGG